MQRSLNAYLNGMLKNEEVIEEMLKLAKQITQAQKEGDELGLTSEEPVFCAPHPLPSKNALSKNWNSCCRCVKG